MREYLKLKLSIKKKANKQYIQKVTDITKLKCKRNKKLINIFIFLTTGNSFSHRQTVLLY